MAQFHNDDLEYVVDEFYDMSGFEDDDDELFAENEAERNNGSDALDSDFEDDLETVRPLCYYYV
jgi:hypothetical protein